MVSEPVAVIVLVSARSYQLSTFADRGLATCW